MKLMLEIGGRMEEEYLPDYRQAARRNQQQEPTSTRKCIESKF
jgi:hypothetical protein